MNKGIKASDDSKITWEKIYEDFEKRHPILAKKKPHWFPHSYATIKIKFLDGLVLLYNYEEHRAIVKED